MSIFPRLTDSGAASSLAAAQGREQSSLAPSSWRRFAGTKACLPFAIRWRALPVRRERPDRAALTEAFHPAGRARLREQLRRGVLRKAARVDSIHPAVLASHSASAR
jgi:hypothetical protein